MIKVIVLAVMHTTDYGRKSKEFEQSFRKYFTVSIFNLRPYAATLFRKICEMVLLLSIYNAPAKFQN
jgi:hypothetical protein